MQGPWRRKDGADLSQLTWEESKGADDITIVHREGDVELWTSVGERLGSKEVRPKLKLLTEGSRSSAETIFLANEPGHPLVSPFIPSANTN